MIPLPTDMNRAPISVERLQRQGWEALRVSDVLPPGSPDTVVLAWARQQGYAVLTQDLDFSTLVALGGYRQPSLITLRLTSRDPEVVADRLLSVLPEIQEALEAGYAITIEDHAVRLRALPIS